MVLVCMVKNCRNAKSVTKVNNCNLFRIPRDLDLSKEWLIKCGRTDLSSKSVENLYNNYRVCMEHFKENMFSSTEKTQLLFTAVPTEFGKPAKYYDIKNPDWIPTLKMGYISVKAKALLEKKKEKKLKENKKVEDLFSTATCSSPITVQTSHTASYNDVENTDDSSCRTPRKMELLKEGQYCQNCKELTMNNKQNHAYFQSNGMSTVEVPPRTLKAISSVKMPTSSASDNEISNSQNSQTCSSVIDKLILKDEPIDLDDIPDTIMSEDEEVRFVVKIENCGLSQDETAKLISIMEKSQPLWDHRMSLHDKSETIKNNLWNELFMKFDGKFSIEELKKSWDWIKEKYIREKKIAHSGLQNKKWVHFKHLRFLDNVLMIQKRTIDNITSEQHNEPSAAKLSKNTLIGSHKVDDMQNRISISEHLNMFQSHESRNEVDKFGSYLSDIMLELPRQRKIILQGKIIAMVVEEIKNHHKL